MTPSGTSENDAQSLRKALRSLTLPELGEDNRLEERIEHFSLDKEKLFLVMRMPQSAAAHAKELEQRIASHLSPLLSGRKLALVLTGENEPPPSSPSSSPSSSPLPPLRRKPPPGLGKVGGLSKVERVIAVASGKGGVGKSTIAVNLALACAESGMKVGLLDADLYGPSLVRMLGLDKPPQRDSEGLLLPEHRFGIKTLSMGSMLEEKKALIWRGPLISRALKQLLQGADWQSLDLLLLDLPPGTGDLPLSLAQSATLDGALLVSTPQQVALYDVRKSRNMFDTLKVPIVGMIENMSVFRCPSCGEESAIFGEGGCEQEARSAGVPFLGRLPLSMRLQESGDKGVPVMAEKKDSAQILPDSLPKPKSSHEEYELFQLQQEFRSMADFLRDWIAKNRLVA